MKVKPAALAADRIRRVLSHASIRTLEGPVWARCMLGSVRPGRCDLVIGLEGQGVSRSRPGPAWTRRFLEHVVSGQQVSWHFRTSLLQDQAPAVAGPVGGAEAGSVVGGLPRLPQAIRDSFRDAAEAGTATGFDASAAAVRVFSRSGS